MAEIRYGPSGLPEAPTFQESFAALLADGYRACEIGFVSGFWLDYKTAPLFGEAAVSADVALSVHAPLAAFMGHADRGKKFKMALGMLDHTAGLAKAIGAELIVFHPGFLLGREREQAIADVVDQLGDLRERLEAKDRLVAFGVEVMGRVRDLGAIDDVLAIAAQVDFVRPVLDFAHMHATSDGAFLEADAFAGALAGADAVLEPGAPFHIHFSDIQYANRNETKHLPYGEGTLRAEPLREALARFERPATVISEAPDAVSTRLIADVLDLGLVGTEMVYFAVGSLELEGGAMVTASHNPKEYTGMKLVRRGALPVGGESGLLDVRDRAMSETDTAGTRFRTGPEGTVEQYDIWPPYVDRVLSFVDVSTIKPLKVVIDAANGMAGAMLPPVLERLPIEAVRCYFEPDGSFPNHEPNPLLPENREFIVRKTLEEGADLGVAFDGDGDRCFFVDDTGEFVPGDFVTALFAENVLEKEPGAKIIYDVRASRAVPDTIERDGGVPLVERVGHAFIKARMRKDDAAFPGQASGHYYFRDC